MFYLLFLKIVIHFIVHSKGKPFTEHQLSVSLLINFVSALICILTLFSPGTQRLFCDKENHQQPRPSSYGLQSRRKRVIFCTSSSRRQNPEATKEEKGAMNVDTTGRRRVGKGFLNGNREEGWESSWAGQSGTMRDVSFNL